MKKVILAFMITFRLSAAYAQAPVQPDAHPAKPAAVNYSNVTAILGAFPAEVTLIHDKMQDKEEIVIQNIRFTKGRLNEHVVVLAQTGIGKVNAAIATTLMLEHFNPAQLLFTGIAGGVDTALSPGDIVIGDKLAYHDYGTITPDSMLRRSTLDPVTMMPNPLYFECAPKLVKLAQQVSSTVMFQKIGTTNRTLKVVTGTIVTGDVFVSSTAATKKLRQKMNAEATEMEGASVAQTCWQQHVPFVVIRSLSDNAGNSAHEDVAAFYKTAAFNSATLVMAIVAKIPFRVKPPAAN